MLNKSRNHIFIMQIIIFILIPFFLNATPIRIMPLGDSITEGNMQIPDNIDVNISNYNGVMSNNKATYRAKLWDQLRNIGYTFDSQSGNLDFVGSKQTGTNYHEEFDSDNEGWSGQTSYYIRNEIENWLDQNPADIVLLHIGTNDPGKSIPIGSYDDADQDADTSVNNVRKILNTIFEKNANSKVFVARIIKNSRAEAWGGWITSEFNNKIVEMINHYSKFSDIKIVDMENGAEMIYNPCGIDMYPHHAEQNNAYDYHPNNNGFVKMGQKWFDALIASGWLPSLTNNRVHLWTLNELGSSFADTGTESNDDATCSGDACPTQTAGQVDYAQQFSGAQTLTASASGYAANDSYSIEFWMNADDTTGLEVAFREGGIWVGRDGNTLKYELPGGPGNHEAGTLNSGWNHVVIVKDASAEEAKAYINGQLTDTSASTATAVNATELYIGDYNPQSTQFEFKGALDEVALYDKALSVLEIKGYYNKATTQADTTKPTIILTGETTVILSVGDSYTDAGATASDNKDGDITANIQTVSTVDTTTAGTYSVKYNVSDAAGNVADEVSRTVVVQESSGERGAELIHDAGNENGLLQAGTSGQGESTYWKGSFNMLRGYSEKTYLLAGNEAWSYIYQPFPTQAGEIYEVKAVLLGADTSRDENFDKGSIIAIAEAEPTSYKSHEIAHSQSVTGGSPTEVTFTFTATSTTSYAVLRGDGSWKYPNLYSLSVKKIGTDDPGTDNIKPVITLIGASVQQIIVGDTYNELGATASDNKDGDITSNIVIDATAVNTAEEGDYIVTYNVGDVAGNNATEVTRTVEVRATTQADTTKPTIILTGETTVILSVGDSYTDAGATASDNKDGDITANIQTVSTVDTTTAGTYSVKYNVSDAAGNVADEVSRTVVVQESSGERGAELIHDAGNENGLLQAGTSGQGESTYWKGSFNMLRGYSEKTYLLAGNEAWSYIYQPFPTQAGEIYEVKAVLLGADTSRDENFDKGSIIAIAEAEPTSYKSHEIAHSQSVTGGSPTEVTFTFTATSTTSYAVLRGDGSWKYPNLYSLSVKKVGTDDPGTDNIKPVITLIGASVQQIIVGDTYNELGATASDNKDGDITSNIVIDATAVNTAEEGDYIVTYNVGDVAGNNATEVTRTVEVRATTQADTTKPTIILTGETTVILSVGDSYTDAGATASDNKDGDITANIQTVSTVDTTTAGTYSVKYNVSDAAGNVADEVSRTVVVQESSGERGAELIHDAGNENGLLQAGTSGQGESTYWKGSFNMLRGYSEKTYLLAGNEAWSYIYQPFPTQVGEIYEVKAVLLGADTSRDENFDKGSIVAIAEAEPTSYKSHEIAHSQSVTGGSPTEVTFTFTATSTTSYAVLRGDGSWKYPNLYMLSVRKK